MAAGIQARGETLEAGAPAALFPTRIAGGGTGLGGFAREQYAVAPVRVSQDTMAASLVTILGPAALPQKRKHVLQLRHREIA